MYNDTDMNIFIMSSLKLSNSTSYNLLYKKIKNIRNIYVFASYNVFYEVIYEGQPYLIPTSVDQIFSIFFNKRILTKSSHTVIKIKMKKIKRILNKQELKDLLFIFEFMDYLRDCVDTYAKQLYPTILSFLDLLGENNIDEGQNNINLTINALSPFYQISLITKDKEGNSILVHREEKLKKLEKKMKIVESKIIKKLDLVSVLEIIPNT